MAEEIKSGEERTGHERAESPDIPNHEISLTDLIDSIEREAFFRSLAGRPGPRNEDGPEDGYET